MPASTGGAPAVALGPKRSRSWRLRRWFVAAGVALSALAWFLLADRDALRAVVDVCVLDARLTASPLPCRSVDTAAGVAVLRAAIHTRPHVIVVPLAPLSGVEDPALLAPDAPNYFAIAWSKRATIDPEASRPLAWADYGLAMNSRVGRSQDQMHIHLACVAGAVRRELGRFEAAIPTDAFVPVPVPLAGQAYQAMRLAKLDGVNVVALAKDKLHLQSEDMADLSLALIGMRFDDGTLGFDLVADLDRPGRDYPAHAEFLLDPTCRS